MTVIFSNIGDVDCSILPTLWEGFDATVIEVTPTTEDWESRVSAALAAETDTLIFAGHGTQYGLLFPDFQKGDYIIHENNVDEIRAERIVCCWCHASDFCAEQGLHGIATGMVISNVDEAYYYGYHLYTQQDINDICRQFYADIHDLLAQDIPLAEWYSRLQVAYKNGIDVFNRQGVLYS